MSVLTTQSLAIGYRQSRRPPTIVARDLNLVLHGGELVCLLGPNGVGKSTLMRTLAGMQPPISGHVQLDGQDVHHLPAQELARRMSVVLTDRVDAGHLSAYELVALGRHPYTDWLGRLTDEDHATVQSALVAVGAQPLAARPVSELSDGERQKVMIARALAQQPAVMLLDEPTAFLDFPRRVEIIGVLRALARRMQCAVLLSTHDLELALRSADSIWLMSPGGELVTGAPEDLALNGAIAATFQGAGLEFDMETGSFRVHHGADEVVAFHATGPLGKSPIAKWTERGLERAGFRVEPNGPQRIQVHLVNGSAAPRWRLTVDGVASEHASLYDLVRAARAAHAQPERV
jgi:iron complex transport system ATP-binding protein